MPKSKEVDLRRIAERLADGVTLWRHTHKVEREGKEIGAWFCFSAVCPICSEIITVTSEPREKVRCPHCERTFRVLSEEEVECSAKDMLPGRLRTYHGEHKDRDRIVLERHWEFDTQGEE